MNSREIVLKKFAEYAGNIDRINSLASDEVDNLNLLEEYGCIMVDWSDTYNMVINWFCEENGIDEEEKNQLKKENVFEDAYDCDYFSMTLDDAFYCIMDEEFEKEIADVKEDGVALMKDVWDEIRNACERKRYSIDGLFGNVNGIEWEITVKYLIVDNIEQVKIPEFKYDETDKKIHILDYDEDDKLKREIYRILIDRKYR